MPKDRILPVLHEAARKQASACTLDVLHLEQRSVHDLHGPQVEDERLRSQRPLPPQPIVCDLHDLARALDHISYQQLKVLSLVNNLLWKSALLKDESFAPLLVHRGLPGVTTFVHFDPHGLAGIDAVYQLELFVDGPAVSVEMSVFRYPLQRALLPCGVSSIFAPDSLRNSFTGILCCRSWPRFRRLVFRSRNGFFSIMAGSR
mmetsp:Transcript_50628/g.158170  ORF Transcript_50628/g.158170 Transcript_50628/m.158170 type:complete len:203 (-) Transcript_50628:1185-1793(-)